MTDFSNINYVQAYFYDKINEFKEMKLKSVLVGGVPFLFYESYRTALTDEDIYFLFENGQCLKITYLFYGKLEVVSEELPGEKIKTLRKLFDISEYTSEVQLKAEGENSFSEIHFVCESGRKIVICAEDEDYNGYTKIFLVNTTHVQMLEKLCSDVNFDEALALDCIEKTALNTPFYSSHLVKTTFLAEAVGYSNIRMVKLLLDNGADPNVYPDDDTSEWPLFELMFPGDYGEEDIRLEITEILLKNHADPNVLIDEESLLDDLLYEMGEFHGIDKARDDYWGKFLILILAYGAKGYYEPKFLGELDKMDIKQYKFVCLSETPYIGKIIDKNGEVIVGI